MQNHSISGHRPRSRFWSGAVPLPQLRHFAHPTGKLVRNALAEARPETIPIDSHACHAIPKHLWERSLTPWYASCRFPAEELFDLYRRRWSGEVFFRDVKIALGMDFLKCQTPEAVRRELAMYLICHNLLREMVQEAAHRHDVPVERISFQGAVEQLSHWLWLFMGNQSHAERRRKLEEFYLAPATAPLPERADRAKPRVRKRRPKNYRLMTRPRSANQRKSA